MQECFFHTFSSGVAPILLAGRYFQLWKKLEKDISNLLYMRSCYPMVTPVDANSRLIVALGQLPEDDSCQFFPLRLLARL